MLNRINAYYELMEMVWANEADYLTISSLSYEEFVNMSAQSDWGYHMIFGYSKYL